jgi:hypothetical protein
MSLKKGLVFGPNIKLHIFLIDIPEKKNKLEAFALEIEDCCFKNVVSVSISIDIVADKDVMI